MSARAPPAIGAVTLNAEPFQLRNALFGRSRLWLIGVNTRRSRSGNRLRRFRQIGAALTRRNSLIDPSQQFHLCVVK